MADHKADSYSDLITFEDDDIEALTIVAIFKQAPLEVNNNGVVGLRYDGIKDFVKWSNLEASKYVPLLVQMSGYYVAGINTK